MAALAVRAGSDWYPDCDDPYRSMSWWGATFLGTPVSRSQPPHQWRPWRRFAIQRSVKGASGVPPAPVSDLPGSAGRQRQHTSCRHARFARVDKRVGALATRPCFAIGCAAFEPLATDSIQLAMIRNMYGTILLKHVRGDQVRPRYRARNSLARDGGLRSRERSSPT